jgi:shikimate dehydrogenase
LQLIFAVMGNPIEHSLSPKIHQLFAQQTGVDLIYKKILIDESHFESQVHEFFQQGGKGLNITLPCKQRAYNMSQKTTPRCQQAKAANTLWMQNDTLHADNTDGIGLLRDLTRYVNIEHTTILILGAGGAARGIIGPLLEGKPKQVTLANRNISTAEILKQDFAALQIYSLEALAKQPKRYDIIINATSASLDGFDLNLTSTILHKNSFCYDLAYNTHKDTPFVQWAKEQNVSTADGLGMLVEQAAEAYYIWHKLRPNSDKVLAAFRQGR